MFMKSMFQLIVDDSNKLRDSRHMSFISANEMEKKESTVQLCLSVSLSLKLADVFDVDRGHRIRGHAFYGMVLIKKP
ncbi:hypothetical protein L3X38_018726 [Prunus dulcis]|uniref:Uncharacterized protein n=1 Tax=Prunus dulcis TaxID=3755 RepID=A0AAD4WBA6_PRUDU|nr:hypothetical protein L3X38_018726 [Prunus dulcis]